MKEGETEAPRGGQLLAQVTQCRGPEPSGRLWAGNPRVSRPAVPAPVLARAPRGILTAGLALQLPHLLGREWAAPMVPAAGWGPGTLVRPQALGWR